MLIYCLEMNLVLIVLLNSYRAGLHTRFCDVPAPVLCLLIYIQMLNSIKLLSNLLIYVSLFISIRNPYVHASSLVYLLHTALYRYFALFKLQM